MSGTAALTEPRSGPWAVALAGTVALALVVLALLGPLAAPRDPLAVDLTARFEASSLTHPLGTDHLGRDILSRLIAGARTTLGSVAASLGLVVALGLIVGGVIVLSEGRIVDASPCRPRLELTHPAACELIDAVLPAEPVGAA